MVDGSRDFDSKPLSEFLVLDTQILNRLLFFDFLEKLRKAITFNYISTESTLLADLTPSNQGDLLFHVNIQIRSSLSRNLIELLLLLDSLLIHRLSSRNVFNIRIRWRHRLKRQEILNCSRSSDLWVRQERAQEGS